MNLGEQAADREARKENSQGKRAATTKRMRAYATEQ